MRLGRGPAAVLAAVLAPAALLAGAPAAGSAGTPPRLPAAPTAAPTTPAVPRAPAPARVLYRLVGCRSGGAQAYRHGPGRRAVAIGFDDGPAADTPAFVRMLERSHARATFFLVGQHVGASFRPTLLRELRDGIGIPRPELPRDALLQRAP